METLYNLLAILIVIDVLCLVFMFILSCLCIIDEAFFINVIIWLVMILVVLAFIFMIVAFRLDKIIYRDKLGGY